MEKLYVVQSGNPVSPLWWGWWGWTDHRPGAIGMTRQQALAVITREDDTAFFVED